MLTKVRRQQFSLRAPMNPAKLRMIPRPPTTTMTMAGSVKKSRYDVTLTLSPLSTRAQIPIPNTNQHTSWWSGNKLKTEKC